MRMNSFFPAKAMESAWQRTDKTSAWLVAGGLLLCTSVACAAPTISNASGVFSHRSTVTISGAEFGTKSTAAPMIWDDASGSNILDKWSGYWPNKNPAYNATYRSPIRGIAPPHANSARYIAGAHAENSGYDAGWNVVVFKTYTKPTTPHYLYASWYVRADDNWQFCTKGVGDNNFKDFAYSEGRSPYEMPNNLYANHQGLSSRTASTNWTLVDDGANLSIRSPDQNGHNYWWPGGPNYMSGTWTKTEVEAMITPNNDGYFRLRENGKLLVNYVGRTDALPGTTRTVGIGGYAVCSGFTSNWRYFADIYLDLSAARVVLANNADLNQATVIESQVPSAWTSSAITASVNLGKFASGQTAYLFVFDPSGVRNTTGYPVVVGSGTTQSAAPSAPSSLNATAAP